MNTLELIFNHFESLVSEFHKKFRVKPVIKISPFIELRNSLIQEEVLEMKSAINQKNEIEVLDGLIDVIYIYCGTLDLIKRSSIFFESSGKLIRNQETIAIKALYDYANFLRINSVDDLPIEYLNLIIAAFEEVHRSNMSKLVDGIQDLDNTEQFYKEKGIQVKFLYYESSMSSKWICTQSSGDQKGKILKSVGNYQTPNLERVLKEWRS